MSSHDGDIDYSAYTLRELEEALAGIDHAQYPKNYANLSAAYARWTSTMPPAPAPHEFVIDEDAPAWPGPSFDAQGRYIPNSIPKADRIQYVLFSVLLLAYGSYGLWVNDLYVPGRRSRGIHLHDSPAWVMFGAIVCAGVVMLSVVADHFDRRNNEARYRAFAEGFKVIGWGLFGVSLVFGIFR